jgi:hypothetical protein
MTYANPRYELGANSKPSRNFLTQKPCGSQLSNGFISGLSFTVLPFGFLNSSKRTVSNFSLDHKIRVYDGQEAFGISEVGHRPCEPFAPVGTLLLASYSSETKAFPYAFQDVRFTIGEYDPYSRNTFPSCRLNTNVSFTICKPSKVRRKFGIGHVLKHRYSSIRQRSYWALYQTYGNSNNAVAVPVAEWIGRRIIQVHQKIWGR